MGLGTGIEFRYKVVNANSNEPPVSYVIGIAWSNGGKSPDHEGLGIFHLKGLEAVRTAYAELPGLGLDRQLWNTSPLSGPTKIAQDASRYILDLTAQKMGKKSPLIHGGGSRIETRTVGEYFSATEFVCGAEIAAHAGVSLTDRFLDNWERLAIAADEWPQQRWGVCPKVTKLKVMTWGSNGVEVGQTEASRVLDAAVEYSKCVKMWGAMTPLVLEVMIAPEVVKAAIDVTKRRGSLSSLRNALHVHGYLK
jgi:hypothetical protein